MTRAAISSQSMGAASRSSATQPLPEIRWDEEAPRVGTHKHVTHPRAGFAREPHSPVPVVVDEVVGELPPAHFESAVLAGVAACLDLGQPEADLEQPGEAHVAGRVGHWCTSLGGCQ